LSTNPEKRFNKAQGPRCAKAPVLRSDYVRHDGVFVEGKIVPRCVGRRTERSYLQLRAGAGTTCKRCLALPGRFR